MEYIWKDYKKEYNELIDGWLDEYTVKMTGIDCGWDEYINAVIEDNKNYPGAELYCKMVCEKDAPFAVVVFGYYEDSVTISEVIVDPALRGKGMGTSVIEELVNNFENFSKSNSEKFMAVIYPDNIPSQKCFEKAGFSFDHSHEEGDAWYYTFQRKR